MASINMKFSSHTSPCTQTIISDHIPGRTLFSFADWLIISLKHHNRQRTAETYEAALSSFKKFNNGHDIMLNSITPSVIEQYEIHLRERGVRPNTSSFYMRILRAIYNRAVSNGVTRQRNPFRNVYTGVGQTVKRALPLADIKRIKNLDLTDEPKAGYARDMFLLSFLLRGMSFIDMAFLRKTDLFNGQIIYRRRKTGRLLSIAWTREMQLIINRYPQNSTCYLLPIITGHVADERTAYLNATYNINHNLKKVAQMAGVAMPLTMYCARHSWASAAKAKGIPLHIISEGMGHASETTTQIYLASLDTSIIDNANNLIISSI
ncbi:MAG: site-specific integrase [Muribaculaceae bacterium]